MRSGALDTLRVTILAETSDDGETVVLGWTDVDSDSSVPSLLRGIADEYERAVTGE